MRAPRHPADIVSCGSKMSLTIAYVLKTFPILSETFIAREIASVLELGCNVRILVMQRPRRPYNHSIVKENRLAERAATHISTNGVATRAFSALRWLRAAARPAQSMKMLAACDLPTFGIRKGFKHASMMLHALAALRERRIDLVHAHFADEAAEFALSLAEHMDVPATFTAHGSDVLVSPSERLGRTAMRAAKVFAVSDSIRRALCDNHAVPSECVVLQHCGIDTGFFAPDVHVAKDIDILFLGRFHPVKQAHNIIHACEILKTSGRSFHCALVGDGPERSRLKELIREKRLTEMIDIHDPIDHSDAPNWYRRAKLLVLASRSEGLPVVCMEALSCQVPVVAARVGGIPEIIRHEETGLLVPPNDVPALAQSIARLLANDHQRILYGVAGRRLVIEHFDTHTQSAALIEHWRSAIKNYRMRHHFAAESSPDRKNI